MVMFDPPILTIGCELICGMACICGGDGGGGDVGKIVGDGGVVGGDGYLAGGVVGGEGGSVGGDCGGVVSSSTLSVRSTTAP
jgi:hypothetical protein